MEATEEVLYELARKDPTNFDTPDADSFVQDGANEIPDAADGSENSALQ